METGGLLVKPGAIAPGIAGDGFSGVEKAAVLVAFEPVMSVGLGVLSRDFKRFGVTSVKVREVPGERKGMGEAGTIGRKGSGATDGCEATRIGLAPAGRCVGTIASVGIIHFGQREFAQKAFVVGMLVLPTQVGGGFSVKRGEAH